VHQTVNERLTQSNEQLQQACRMLQAQVQQMTLALGVLVRRLGGETPEQVIIPEDFKAMSDAGLTFHISTRVRADAEGNPLMDALVLRVLNAEQVAELKAAAPRIVAPEPASRLAVVR
jgi:hypothetical protein